MSQYARLLDEVRAMINTALADAGTSTGEGGGTDKAEVIALKKRVTALENKHKDVKERLDKVEAAQATPRDAVVQASAAQASGAASSSA